MLLLLLPNRSRITYKMLTMIPLYRGISIKSLNETMYEIYLSGALINLCLAVHCLCP